MEVVHDYGMGAVLLAVVDGHGNIVWQPGSQPESRRLNVLEALLGTIQRELVQAAPQRSTGATDISLASAAALCQAAADALSHGQSAVAGELLGRLARTTVDEWSLDSPVTAEVTRCAQELTG